jgi:predicted DNA-binding protein (MmcQ/YjbR family)
MSTNGSVSRHLLPTGSLVGATDRSRRLRGRIGGGEGAPDRTLDETVFGVTDLPLSDKRASDHQPAAFRDASCASRCRYRKTGGVSDAATVDDEILGRLRDVCRRFPGADEGELQDRPLFRVGRRRFAIFNGATFDHRPRWATSGRSLHFLADPGEIDALWHDGRFSPSPHHGDRGWLTLGLEDAESTDWAEIGELLESAYRQVAPRHRQGGP